MKGSTYTRAGMTIEEARVHKPSNDALSIIRDTGIYRCLATRSYDSSYNYRSSYGRKETIYMEIDFIPRGRSYGSRNEYSGYSSARDDYRDRPYSSRDNVWFR